MQLRLWNGNLCIKERRLKSDEDYKHVGNFSTVIYDGQHYAFNAVFDGAINFQATDQPKDITAFMNSKPARA